HGRSPSCKGEAYQRAERLVVASEANGCAFSSRHPIRDEHVDLMRRLRVAVRDEHQFLSIWRKLRECAESSGERRALHRAAILVHGVEFELAGTRMLIVRRENDSVTLRIERWSEARAAHIRDLLLLRAIRPHHEEIHGI